MAAKLGLALICPDTSPRGCGIEGEEDDWDFGNMKEGQRERK